MTTALQLYNLPREVWIPLTSLCHLEDLGNLATTCPALYHILIETETLRSAIIHDSNQVQRTPKLLFKMPIKSLQVGHKGPFGDVSVHLPPYFLKSLPPTVEVLRLRLFNLEPTLYVQELEDDTHPTDELYTTFKIFNFGEHFPKLHTLHVRSMRNAAMVPQILRQIPHTVTSLSLQISTDVLPLRGDKLPPNLLRLRLPTSRLILHESLTKLTKLNVAAIDLSSDPMIPIPTLTSLKVHNYDPKHAFMAPNLIKLNIIRFSSVRSSRHWPSRLQSLTCYEPLDLATITTLPQSLTYIDFEIARSDGSNLDVLYALPASLRTIVHRKFLSIPHQDYAQVKRPPFLPKLETLNCPGVHHAAGLFCFPRSLTHYSAVIGVDNGTCSLGPESEFFFEQTREFVATHSVPGTYESHVADFLPNARSLLLQLWQPIRLLLPRNLTELSIAPPFFPSHQALHISPHSCLDLLLEELPHSLTALRVLEKFRSPSGACFDSLPPRITHLDFKTSFEISQDFLAPIPPSESLTKLPKFITTLRLWVRLPDASFFGALPRHLKSFDFRRTENIRDEDIAELPRDIQELALRDAVHLTNRGFRLLPQTLTLLALNRSRLLTPAIFDHLPKKLMTLHIRRHNGFPRHLSHGHRYGLSEFVSRKCCWNIAIEM